MTDLDRIDALLRRPLDPWATALLRAMKRNMKDGHELSEMHRSALDRIERLHMKERA